MGSKRGGPPKRPWSPIPQEDGTLLVPLTRGLFARIDAADLPLVAPYCWSARVTANATYAIAGPYRAGGKTTLSMHRVILGAPPGLDVDHLHGDGLDNRRAKLRLCTRAQNRRNTINSKHRKAGGLKGISKLKDREQWIASIRIGSVVPGGRSRSVYLGRFSTPEDAARAYDAAALEHFGEFACLNFPANDANSAASGGAP